ncbi:hypothetical protein HK097_004156 [Rhizophlyctis rosea]|uniref:Chitin-binding type-3 domain-containing protein n=1 Tax=Rhizophlyctis rosea TaxID=64517 RepID=A0AAD5S1W0_9FUNG|nr:hypothetical protein HK097_004156 [Rhizophlyctis rosea]
MRIASKLLCVAALVASYLGQVAGQTAAEWKVGTKYTAGQTISYQGTQYKVLVNHIGQADWYPGCCAALWSVVAASSGAPGEVTSAVTVPASAPWPTRVFAPYCDILLWPTLNITTVAQQTGVKYYTLAFLISDAAGNPAWGGMTPLEQGFYGEYINGIRRMGGDVIISFGGLNGEEIATTNTDVTVLQSKYEAVIQKYNVTAVDYDIEGHGLIDTPSIDRRNKAIAGFQKKYPKIRVSYTLPVLPTGLTASGVSVLQSAKRNGARIDVVNIMTMDYGGGVAPQGGTMMGSYAISAAQATYKQSTTALGSTTVKIGVTPMIGQNDVAGEIFRLVDSVQVTNWALTTPWMSTLAMWSINRDIAKTGLPLYASSQITQKDYDFAKNFVKFTSGGAITTTITTPPVTTTTKPITVPTASRTYVIGKLPVLKPSTMIRLAARGVENVQEAVQHPLEFIGGIVNGSIKSEWKDRTFAPYVDLTTSPPYDFHSVGEQYGINHYTLAFISADENGKPTWAGANSLDAVAENVAQLRNNGGDVILSFSGSTSPDGKHLQELSQHYSDEKELEGVYQSVIDKYQASWVEFVIQDEVLADRESLQRRNKVLKALKGTNKGLRVSFTIPVEADGVSREVKYLLENAKKVGLELDVLNLMTVDYPTRDTLLRSIISSTVSTHKHITSLGFTNTRIGITPWIGKNEYTGETLSLQDAFELVKWARSKSWVGEVSYWSVNRDVEGESGVVQGELGFAQALAVFDD